MKKFCLAVLCFFTFPFAIYAADVQISQLTDTPDPATRGGDITYSISLLNANNDTATDVTLTVPLPTDTTFVSVNDANCTHDGGTPGTLNCNFGDITGDGLGSPVTDIDLIISTNGATANTISLTATVATTSVDSNPANDSVTQNTTIDNGADLAVTARDNIDPIIAGGSYQYTLDVQNIGPNNASNLVLTSTLPNNVTFQSATGAGWTCGNAAQVVTCTRSALSNGATAPSVIIDVTATGAVVGTVTNSINITADTKDPDSANNTATENTQINLGTELTLAKSVATPVISNGTTTFTLTPRNLGPYDANNVSITDTLPVGFNFISATGTGWVCNEAGGTVTCTRAAYTVGATDDITIQTTVPATGTNVLNTAVLTSTTSEQNNVNNTGSTIFSIIPDGSDLSISKSKTPNPVALGANMTSTISVTNDGPSSTTGSVQVVDTLSVNESYVSFSGTNWNCTHLAGVVTCDYALNLANGDTSSVLEIVTSADAAGSLSNTACVTDVAGQPDNDNSNNCANASSQSTLMIADLSISKSVFTAGGANNILETNESRITYVLDVINTGEDISDTPNATADGGVVITDSIPGYVSGETLINATITGGTQQNFTCSVTNAVVECILNDGQVFQGSGDGGGDDTVQITITVDRGLFDGNFTNTANVDSRLLGENNIANNSSSVAIQIAPVADVELQSVVITPSTLEAGTIATYVITFINNGPSTAANSIINHLFSPPAGRTYQLLSSTPSQGSCAALVGNNLNCTIGSLARNQTETITLTVMPGWDGANDAWTMPSTTSISTSTIESNAANNSQIENLNVVKADLDLLVNLTDVVDPVGWSPTPGAFPATTDNVIVYQVDITNRGPSLATGVTLVDVMSPKTGKQVTLLCDDVNSTGCTVGTSLCNNLNTSATGPATITTTCGLPNLNANSSTTRYLYYRVDTTPDSVGDTHANQVTISSNEDDSIPSNDNESETTSVRVLVDLAVDKSASSANVSINEPFNWNILVSNNGPGDSANSALSDNLPAGMVLTGTPIPAQGSCTGVAGNTSFTCSLGTINNGGVVAVTVPSRIVTKPAGNTLTNTASVTTFGVDSNAGNNNDSDTVTILTSSISGSVFNDINGNGLIDASEHGISNVTVTLSGVDLWGNNINIIVNTDVDGNYTFENLPPGNNYTITETQPANFNDGLDSANNVVIGGSTGTDSISGIVLTSNTDLVNYNFAERGRSSLAGSVWFDENNNGSREGAEVLGIEAVVISLSGTETVSGKAINISTTTNAIGQYTFGFLTQGTYTLSQIQPNAWSDGLEQLGTAGGTLGNDTFTGITLSANQSGVDYNFGEISAQISGYVYRDNNNDGLKNVGESGISNVRISLTGTDLNAFIINRSTRTNATGFYQFTGVPASNGTGYTLVETQPDNVVDGKDTIGSLGGTLGNDTFTNIITVANANGTNYNFGEGQDINAGISGRVFVDQNNSNVWEPEEPGIANVKILLSGRNSLGEVVSITTYTDNNGEYAFNALLPSDANGYTITQIHPEGYADSVESIDGQVLTNSNRTDLITDISLVQDQFLTDVNFAELEKSSISGFVYLDNNNNGLMENTEQPLSSVTLTLSGLDYHGTPISIEIQTNENGYYIFESLLPSDTQGYTINQQQPSDYIDGLDSKDAVVIADSDTSDVLDEIVLFGNEALENYNFGEQETSSVSGYVWVDENDDGLLQSSESFAIEGVTITLNGIINSTSGSSDEVTLSTQTDENGYYSFTNLFPGVYQIIQSQPLAWLDGKDQLGSLAGEISNDIFSHIEILAGNNGENYNFGERGSELSGLVYSDLNDNAIKESNEAGIPEVEIRLFGVDLDGNAVNRIVQTSITGEYIFEHLPLSNDAGYSISETQPANVLDGKESLGDLGGNQENDLFTAVNISQHLTSGQGYNFGEILENPASISGFVWLDSNHNRAEDDGKGLSGWTVELLVSRDDPKNNENFTVIATVNSESDGSYLFEGLSAGLYEIRFIHPQGGVIYGYPVSNYPGVDLTAGTIRNIALTAGEHIPDQNLPIDPSGIVYNSKTREPVAGATVVFSGPAGFDPDRDLVGGSANATQVTSNDGLYQYLLFTSAPSGTYTLTVTQPAGYIPGVSTIIPACTNTAKINAIPNPALVQAKDVPPALDAPIHQASHCPINSEGFASSEHTTQYYLSFDIDPQLPSANVVNNHIPLDPYDNETLQVTKTSTVKYVNRGDIVPYTISVTNNLNTQLTGLSVVDQLPPGFKYVASSATINGLAVEPNISDNTLTWSSLTFAANEEKQIQLLAVIGTGVAEGEHTNQAWANSDVTIDAVTDIAKATVQLTSDPIFDCSDITGKVFDDHNINGYQDEGETGLANIRIATARGQLITTDSNGRFHIACAEVPNELRGSNFILKLDDRTLPSGYRITTENPRVTRLTRGKVNKVNFGAALHRVVRVQLTARAFAGEQLAPNYQQGLQKAIKALQLKPSVLRIAYVQGDESNQLVESRLANIIQHIESQWQQCDCQYPLAIETEVSSSANTTLQAQGGE